MRGYLISEVDRGVEYLAEDMRKTIVGSLFEPVFRVVIGPEQRERTIKLLDKIVSLASSGPISNLDELLANNEADLLAIDPVNQNLRKSLRIYEEAKEYLRESYRNRIRFYNKLLMDSKDVQKWEDLYTTSFESGEECLAYIMPEIEANKKLLALIK
ncbi:MAG: hypothetical protein ACXQS8_07675, partial [Candidatus Helarchaeales archaeon]